MKKKNIVIIILFVIVAMVAIFFVRKNRASDQTYEQGIVIIGDVHKTIKVDATLQPDTAMDIVTEIPTRIAWVGVEINDQVEKGQEILRLDKTSINAQIKNGQLAVERAELAEQQGRLKSSGLSTKDKLSLKKATEQERQSLNEVYAQAKKTSITSAIDGVVIKQEAIVGEVASGILVRIINPESLQIEALIPEVDMSRVHVGDSAYMIFDAYPGKKIQGNITMIELGSINLQGNTYYKAILTMDDIDEIVILDGMNADVHIEFVRENDVLAVPRTFAQKDDVGYFVYATDTSRTGDFVKQYFTEGLIGDEYIEVIDGLTAGQEVVLPIAEDN